MHEPRAVKRHFFRLRPGWAGCLLLVLWLAGCAASVEPEPSPGPYAADGQPPEAVLRSGIRPWLGTPHRMGGMGKNGIDCSGLTVRLYRDLFHMQLPRTTAAQMRRGRPVTRSDLAAGDLVFFKPVNKKYYHVGIYLEDGEFVHTSTSNGVMISRMDDDYWRRCYLTGRRLLP
ncbi:lipoprotein [Desulfosarcina widdelii]|uniref:Lipoprotein n=1 Tax=Desulfosarcina widdelii TaxID=947919 RepID=A0A5K7ZCM5_9BACT|nr:NlpC/P60 family protein [Desulfosarcina widdelii]BBO74007.1 lipoprotein [Desulfosarcina widdelii]